MTRSAFNSVGGFNAQFPTTFNDTVLCCDLYAKGHRTVYLAEALLITLKARHAGQRTRQKNFKDTRTNLLSHEVCIAIFSSKILGIHQTYLCWTLIHWRGHPDAL